MTGPKTYKEIDVFSTNSFLFSRMTTRILKQNYFGLNSGNYKTIKKEKGVIRCQPNFALIAVNELALK
jgi:hypothetical protein